MHALLLLLALPQVVVTEGTRAAVAAAQAAGRSCWRVSSTLFSHIASDVTLQPLGPFQHEAAAAGGGYPPVKAGQQVSCHCSFFTQYVHASVVNPTGIPASLSCD